MLKVTLNIEFDEDTYKVKRSSAPKLREFADVAKILNGTYIQIEGNTAHVDEVDGKKVSEERARSVAKYLQALGIDSERFIIVANGDKNPIYCCPQAVNSSRARIPINKYARERIIVAGCF